MEFLPEGLVLDVVPADAYTQAQSTTGQKVNIGRLPRDERGLTLGKDKDTRGKANSQRNGSQIRKHYERVMERVVLGVGAGELRSSTGVDGAKDVVVGEEGVAAPALARPPN